MRKLVIAGMAVLIAVLIGATTIYYQKYQHTTANLRDVQEQEEMAQKRYNQTIDAIAEIQASLNSISVGDTNVRMVSRDLSAEKTGPNSQDALDRIAALRASIEHSKARIEQLERSLKLSGIKVAGLEKMITNLKASVAEKEQLVADLSGQVDALNTQVTSLTTEVQQNQDTLKAKDETIEEKRRENATVYYIVGTKKDLTKSGVVVASGGVLGVGKTLLAAPTNANDQFKPLDTDQETVVQTSAAKARVLSAQPASSYELRLVDGHMELHIINPNEFRKVKQLVIMTA